MVPVERRDETEPRKIQTRTRLGVLEADSGEVRTIAISVPWLVLAIITFLYSRHVEREALCHQNVHREYSTCENLNRSLTHHLIGGVSILRNIKLADSEVNPMFVLQESHFFTHLLFANGS